MKEEEEAKAIEKENEEAVKSLEKDEADAKAAKAAKAAPKKEAVVEKKKDSKEPEPVPASLPPIPELTPM